MKKNHNTAKKAFKKLLDSYDYIKRAETFFQSFHNKHHGNFSALTIDQLASVHHQILTFIEIIKASETGELVSTLRHSNRCILYSPIWDEYNTAAALMLDEKYVKNKCRNPKNYTSYEDFKPNLEENINDLIDLFFD